MNNREHWRKKNPHRLPDLGKGGYEKGLRPDLPEIPAIRFFDNLAYIGDGYIGCFILYTSDGFMLLDAMFDGEKYEGILERGLADLGINGKDIRYALITHGHADHYGMGQYMREKYGTKVFLSQIDDVFARDKSIFSPIGYLEYPIDCYIEDGVPITLGDTTVLPVLTPGHTPGCMSFIFTVYDEGRKHTAAMWGGTGAPRELAAAQEYLRSVDKFDLICDEHDVDVEISSHPFVDNGTQRLELCRNIFDGVAHPFVIGREAYKRYENMFRDRCITRMNAVSR